MPPAPPRQPPRPSQPSQAAPPPSRQPIPSPAPRPPVDPNRYLLRPDQQVGGHRRQQRTPDHRRTVIIAGLTAVAVVGVGIGIWQFGFDRAPVIKVETAEAGVRAILSDPINGYGANSISALRCNGGKNPSAAKGDSFTCDVEIDGAVRQVYAEFTDDRGTFAVDGPR
ncbi:DUF4333 domain-containing protein [Mycolicibacterium sp. A43C]